MEPRLAGPIDTPGLPPRLRRRVLLITLGLGLLLFVWQLGCTGLVDETPPLFAASARAMARTGDWLIPRVNGLPRYDKPPLVYWLMALGYSLPGQEIWNPLGTWAARMPSALSAVAVMLALADTLLRWPQPPRQPATPRPALTAVGAALAFALSPLVLLWARIAVSDALFTATLAISLLLCWQVYGPAARPWWTPWIALAAAVLAKGPVAVLLVGLTLLLFGWLQADLAGLWRRLRPARGLLLTALLAAPWYLLALLREGRPFWDSFFGYHNLQRFTVVVNHHLQPWWFFGPVLVVASLPCTPLLVQGLVAAVGPLRWRALPAAPLPPAASLGRFAACWLLAVLLFFTVAATKLPSYWLPATPAAGLLVALAAQRANRWALGLSLALAMLLSAVFAAAPLWVPLIQDPELPTLPAELLASGRLWLASACVLLAPLLGWLWRRRSPLALLGLQLPMVLFVVTALLPLWAMGDRLRGLPVRQMAAAVGRQAAPREPLAMVGILKPSLHYYSGRVVIYEGISPSALLNLMERLERERRQGQQPSSITSQPTVLVVIDQGTAALPHWRGLQPTQLGQAGLYRLWRLDRRRLAERARVLAAAGERATWQRPVPERY
jgi:4-amino-4-deoxy-L-arabinose transferase-like glycosyltransferase